MRPTYRLFVHRVVPVAVLAAAFGCGDGPEARTKIPTGPNSTTTVGDLDSAIDPTDSYATADVEVATTLTMSSDTSMVNPQSGDTVHTLTVSAPPDTLHFQTGFTTSGDVVATTYYAPDEESAIDPRDVAKTRIVAGVATDFDAAGNPVYDTEAEALSGPAPLTELPVFTGTSLIDALAPPKDSDPGDGSTTEPTDQEVAPREAGVSPRLAPSIFHPVAFARATRTATSRAQSRFPTRVERPSPNEVRLLTETTLPATADRPRTAGRLSRTYRREPGERWRLAELEIEQRMQQGASERVQRQRVRIQRLRHHENADRDLQRRSSRRARPGVSSAVPVLFPVSHATAHVSARPTRQRPPGIRGAHKVGAGPHAAMLAAATCDPARASLNSYRDATSVGLSLQHGFLSNACTWQRMDGWIRAAYDRKLGAYVITNTPSLESYATQADSLINWIRWIDGPLRRPWILIGHSNGGIISRIAARKMLTATSGPRPLGVITINSPQQGAPAMNFAFAATAWTFAQIMSPFAKLCALRSVRGCGEYLMVTNQQAWPTILSTFLGNKVYFEMRTDAPIRRTLNDPAPEAGFVKASIVTQSPRRWLVFRMYADANCNPEESVACAGGREQGRRTNRLVKHLKKRALLGTLATLTFAFINPDVASDAFDMTALTLSQYGAIVAADRLWREIVSKDAHSDGIVPVESQWYPNVPRDPSWYIAGGDTHVGATRSPYVRPVLEAILLRKFGLQKSS